MSKRIPPAKDDLDLTEKDWQISRKAFVRSIILSGIALQLPWLQSCGDTSQENFGDIQPLTLTQFKTLRTVQLILFPADGNGPSAIDIKADYYVLWILKDAQLDPEENEYILKRLTQFREYVKANYKQEFIDLNEMDQVACVNAVAQEDWGQKWLSRVMTLILEALLLDPLYGGNTNEAGWKWLEHDPGRPRPTKQNTYPLILKKHGI